MQTENNRHTAKHSLPRRAQRRLSQYWHTALHGNRYYSWYVSSRKLTNAWEEQLMDYYSKDCAVQANPKAGKTVVFICNGTILSGGLADRLKGIISTYMLCKERGWQFKLLFSSPFPLELYLIPNRYDWMIKAEDVMFDLANATPIPLEISEESNYQAHKQKQWLRERISSAKTPQVHIYTNAMFSYLGDFSTAFNELFRPSERLQRTIDTQLDILKHNYVSISARFLNNLGDFTDTVDIEPLPKQQQEQLLSGCMECIRRCHELHPDKCILVNSDSKRFLDEASRLPYTYVVPGTITHIDTECNDTGSLYERYEKTILDYLLIANATHIYRIDGKWLHTSGYPLSASRINNRPFTILRY